MELYNLINQWKTNLSKLLDYIYRLFYQCIVLMVSGNWHAFNNICLQMFFKKRTPLCDKLTSFYFLDNYGTVYHHVFSLLIFTGGSFCWLLNLHNLVFYNVLGLASQELNRQKVEYERKKKTAEQLRIQQEEEEKEQRRKAAQRIQEEQKAMLERQLQESQ